MNRALPFVLLLAAFAASFAIRTINLGHPSLAEWDESYHALVAKNVLKHPLKPTLIDNPVLPFGAIPQSPAWAGSHVWFHKGTLPAWLGAAGMAVAPGTIGYRGMSLALMTGSLLLLFLIGRRLFSSRAGAIAALLFAVNPYFTGLVRGVSLSDMVDSTLLFFVLAGFLAMIAAVESGRRLQAALAGAATGLAFLSKYYLALLVPAAAVVLVLVNPVARRVLLRPEPVSFFVGGLLAVVGPWVAYFYARFPVDFATDVLYYVEHLGRDVENWSAPWDRFVFDYLPNAARDAFVPGLFAVVVLRLLPGRRERLSADVMLAWLLAATIPHTIATTKVWSYGVLPAPCFILLAAALLDEAFKSSRAPLAVATAAMLTAMILPPVFPGILTIGRGPGPGTGIFSVAAYKPWIWWQVAATLVFGVALGLLTRYLRGTEVDAWFLRACKAVCAAGLVAILLRQGQDAVSVARRASNPATVLSVAEFARTTDPASVFFLCPGTIEHAEFMFYSDRTAYIAKLPDVYSILSQMPLGRPVYVMCEDKPGKVVFESSRDWFVSRIR